MEATHDDAATRPETLQYTEHAPVPPSLWRSVLHAFRQARLARLEARLQRVRQYASCPSTSREQPVILVPTERVPQHEDAAWLPVTTARPPQRLWIIVTVALLTLTGISLSAFLLRSRVMTAEALPPPPESPMTSVARETIELRTLLARLDDRVTVLQHQVMQHGDQLTNQTATMLSVSQHADTHETQLATLADMVTALTAQVAYVEQQVMTQATRLAAQDKQLATQAVQLGTVRERDAGLSVVCLRLLLPVVPVVRVRRRWKCSHRHQCSLSPLCRVRRRRCQPQGHNPDGGQSHSPPHLALWDSVAPTARPEGHSHDDAHADHHAALGCGDRGRVP